MAQESRQHVRKIWFLLSVSINLGFLGFFKYCNFFIESFKDAISLFGVEINTWTLNVILPVGISFYTFHGLSYVFDIYRKRIEVEKNFIDYALFVSFFPLLVAGPIERTDHLLPQIKKTRSLNYLQAIDGLKQILWGLFKKVVIADQCAEYVNLIFSSYKEYEGSTLVLGPLFFAFQVYGDFSGYSDIALGTARLLGIELLKNFAFPYFSRDIAEFWRRWHISLSTWFRDYVYIPLGGSKQGTLITVRNVFIIFALSGFWHGADWHFIVWGLINAVYVIPSILMKTSKTNLDIVAQGRYLPTIKELFSMIITFCLTIFAYIIFRSESIPDAISFIERMFSPALFTIPKVKPVETCLLIVLFMGVEWIGREQPYAIAKLGYKLPRVARWGVYYVILLALLYFAGPEQQFIYFQF
ncbi:MBOAT family protein [Spirosoma harenae]